ncbi:MAG: Flp pilus assembly complex ATPase component TadA [Armatimonadetes bacterium]|nr:Flp pilus assembly complex ATPase component TadA [Armatimonadota bacterium]
MEEYYKKPLGDILLDRGMITDEQLHAALDEQKQSRKRLGEVLVSLGFITEEQVTEARALQFDVGYVNLQEQECEPEAIASVSDATARTYNLVPFKMTGNRLTVAMANPLDVEAIDLVQFEAKCRVEPMLATEWRIVEVLNKQYGGGSSEDLQDMAQEAASTPASLVDSDEHEDIDEVRRKTSSAPIVRMVNMLLTQAVRRKASDIHIEPRRDTVDVRYRIDGELHIVRSFPKALHAAIASRIKIMSELDISERRLPQDGRITVKLDKRMVDLRVSTSPIIYGERVVLRILDRASGMIPLDQLGFAEVELDALTRLVSQPHGIILVTGPTGSGKTTTLYAVLNVIKSESTNIMTVEDPVEYELEGINQTNVHHKIGLTFANQLRAILRQDPDVVLVGEIRDTETADVAFRAALTGHLVLSTLHCNDAPSAITRLVDQDVEPFLVGSAINGVVAQRLVRVLCPDCKEAYSADEKTVALLGLDPGSIVTLYRPGTCANCDGTGYKGRICINELMVMDDELRRLTMLKSPASELRKAAIASGMRPMAQDGTEKVLAGITTIEEVQRKVFVETEDTILNVRAA